MQILMQIPQLTANYQQSAGGRIEAKAFLFPKSTFFNRPIIIYTCHNTASSLLGTSDMC